MARIRPSNNARQWASYTGILDPLALYACTYTNRWRVPQMFLCSIALRAVQRAKILETKLLKRQMKSDKLQWLEIMLTDFAWWQLTEPTAAEVVRVRNRLRDAVPTAVRIPWHPAVVRATSPHVRLNMSVFSNVERATFAIADSMLSVTRPFSTYDLSVCLDHFALLFQDEPEWRHNEELLQSSGAMWEIFGNPFVKFFKDIAVYTNKDVQHIVKDIVATHDFESLPILADALEDAGCKEWAVVDHCRNRYVTQTHLPGCWVLRNIFKLGRRRVV